MHSKREVRQLAMQVLFAWDAGGDTTAETARQVVAGGTDNESTRQGAIETATSAWEGRQTADAWLERLAPQWPVRRQPGVDRAILRLAVWELTSTPTPPKVVIDEAIELAKAFSTEQSAAFINGVMDAVLREHQTLVKE